MTTPYTPPEWAFEFHGHRCPFMPIGYRMGRLAMERSASSARRTTASSSSPSSARVIPQTCMMDGIQAATGATYGKLLMAKTFYGKLAAVFYHPDKGAVRYALNAEFMDAMGKFEFFVYRKRGIEPSEIPVAVTDEVINWVAAQPDETVFKVGGHARLLYTPVKGSFNKTKCASCGEYVFDRYVRMKDGEPVCIPCSGYEPATRGGRGITMTDTTALRAAGDTATALDLQLLADDMTRSSASRARRWPSSCSRPDADMAPFAGWTRVQRHRYCQALMKARRGERVMLEADELACPAAARAFGFRPLPPALQTGKGLVGFGIVAEPESGARCSGA